MPSLVMGSKSDVNEIDEAFELREIHSIFLLSSPSAGALSDLAAKADC